MEDDNLGVEFRHRPLAWVHSNLGDTWGGGPAPLTAAFYEQFAHRSVCRLQFYAQEALTDIEMAQCVNV